MKKCVIILILLCDLMFCQTEHPLDYFPHHVGDLWQYIEQYSGTFTEIEITRIDTSDDDKYRYVYYNENQVASFKIDVDSAIVYSTFNNMVYIKLNCSINSFWETYANEWWSRYIGLDTNTVFNENIVAKVFHQYTQSEPGDSSTLERIIDYYGYNIGRYKSISEFEYETLLGCIINGQKYGNIILNIHEESSDLPKDFSISQNYPNPFNGETLIQYYVPQYCIVNIAVYDLLGRVIEVLVNEFRSPGSYVTTFHPYNLPSGTYFYRLALPSKSITKKLVYIK